MLRPIIKTVQSYKYPLVDNPFYDNNGNLIGEERLIKTILDAERETSEDLSLKVEVLSAAIFGSVAERYTRRKIRLNPNSDLDLFVELNPYNFNLDAASLFSSNLYSLYEEERQKDNTGIFLLPLHLRVSYKSLGEWEEDQGFGFFIDNYYPLLLKQNFKK